MGHRDLCPEALPALLSRVTISASRLALRKVDATEAMSGSRPFAKANALKLLRAAHLVATRPRLSLAVLLFARGNRHVTAEQLHREAEAAAVRVSLATVYNTLHQFVEAGLLGEVVVDSGRSYFDTNVSDHHHFFFEDTGRLLDIPGERIGVTGVPKLPASTAIRRVDVIIRVGQDPARSATAGVTQRDGAMRGGEGAGSL